MRKLDPALKILVERRREYLEAGSQLGAMGREGLEPLVRVKQHPTLEYTVAAGFIPVDRLEDLEGIPHVVKTEASRPMRLELNRSVPEFVPTSFTTPPLLSKVLAWSLA